MDLLVMCVSAAGWPRGAYHGTGSFTYLRNPSRWQMAQACRVFPKGNLDGIEGGGAWRHLALSSICPTELLGVGVQVLLPLHF